MSQLARIVTLKRGCPNIANICIGDIVYIDRIRSYSIENVYSVRPVLTHDKWVVSVAVFYGCELEIIE